MADKKEALSKINAYVDAHRDEMTQFLMDFIAIPSLTYEEGPAVQWLAGKMKEFGYDEVRIDKVGNVLGRVGSGPSVFLCDAHIDTVEGGDEKAWGFNPFETRLEDGVVKGRGAVDDKGCLTGLVFAGRAIKELGLGEEFTYWVSGSVSEEDVEGSCVEAMTKEAADIKPDFIVVAEASEGRIIRGHKGRALIRITVPGKAAHASAAWRGDNALIKALPIIDRVDKFQDFVEDPFLGKGTIEVTKVDCKTPSLNTIPGEVVVICDRRISCGESIEDLLAEVGEHFKDIPGVVAEIDTENVTTYTGYDITCVDYFPSWVLPESHPLIEAGVLAFREQFEEEPTVGKWDFCTNATHLCGRMGIPAIGYGPGDGSLCHSTQDQLSVDELVKATKFYASLPLFAAAAK